MVVSENGLTLASIISLSIGLIVGALVAFAGLSAGRSLWDRFIGWLRIKQKPHRDEVICSLSYDTQIILKQYMQEMYHYGETIYAVNNLKLFDYLIQNHIKKSFGQPRGCKLQHYIEENLKNGTGFLIVMNGEQYVAIPPPILIDTISV